MNVRALVALLCSVYIATQCHSPVSPEENEQYPNLNQADTLIIKIIDGDMVAQIMWTDNALSEDLSEPLQIEAAVSSDSVMPPSQGGTNYLLAPAIQVSIDSTDPVYFKYDRVKLRYYNQHPTYSLDQFRQNVCIYSVTDGTKFECLNPEGMYIVKTSDYYEIILTNLKPHTILIFTAVNILSGNYLPEDLVQNITGDLYIPVGDTVLFHPGVALTASEVTEVVVDGFMQCIGTEDTPITFENIGL